MFDKNNITSYEDFLTKSRNDNNDDNWKWIDEELPLPTWFRPFCCGDMFDRNRSRRHDRYYWYY